MFDYIKGLLTNKNYPYLTVENNGIGYEILVNARTLETIGEIETEIKIYTKLIHKEDIMYLCGFKNKQEKIIFNILTSLNGIGPKVAFALLDEFEANELINLVINEDHKTISRTKGVGAKMAQKIVLELKDKLTKMDVGTQIISAKINNSKISNDTINQATIILQSLGYNQNEYNSAIETALTQLKKDDAEELLKECLKILSVF